RPDGLSLPRFFSRICKITSPGHVAGSSKPHAPSPTVGLELRDADVGHRDLLEQVWRSDDRGGISRQFGSELRMPECSPVVSGRFPDGIVEIRRAFAKSSVKLGGDEARLALHESSVVLPSLEKGLLVRFIERDHIPARRGRPRLRSGVRSGRRGQEGAAMTCKASFSTWFHDVCLVRCNMSY